MGFKEQRDARRDELYSQFVSVKDLIQWFSDQEGLDISEVAGELERLIKGSDGSALPVYGFVDEAAIEFVPYSVEQCREHLLEMVSDSVTLCGHGDASDHHGWLRKELFPFFQHHGIDVPHTLPAWEPQEIQPPKKDVNDSPLGTREKELGSKERNTLLCLIAAILDQHGIDFCNPERGTAKKIEDWVSGIGASVTEETIKGVLDKLPGAVMARSK